MSHGCSVLHETLAIGQVALRVSCMTAKVIDGKAIAKSIRAEQTKRVERLRVKTGVTPGLAVVLVGDSPASKVYVNNKRRALVVGASNIVGKPMGLMLMHGDATVSICHAKTRDLAQFTILADILVVAAGVPNLIRAEMVRYGAVVIDVGINRLPDNSITGDVDFEAVRKKASHITPVPRRDSNLGDLALRG